MRDSPAGVLTQDALKRPVLRFGGIKGLMQGHVSDYGRDWFAEYMPWYLVTPEGRLRPKIAGGSGFSQFVEHLIIDHANNVTTWTQPAGSFMALCTTLPTAASTGSTIVEATYTGYARLTNAGNWTAATNATPSVGVNTATMTFAACTAGSSVLMGFALCSAITTGNVIWWGSLSSTTISTTQTPATVAAGVLQVSLT